MAELLMRTAPLSIHNYFVVSLIIAFHTGLSTKKYKKTENEAQITGKANIFDLVVPIRLKIAAKKCIVVAEEWPHMKHMPRAPALLIKLG